MALRPWISHQDAGQITTDAMNLAGPDYHGKKIVILRVHGEIIEPVLFEFMKHIIVCYGVYFVTR